MRAVVFRGGKPATIAVRELPDLQPTDFEILVAVRYAGLNPSDVGQREGHYAPPPGAPPNVAGIELAGIVMACGARALRWKPGDRVFGLTYGGGLSDRVLVHESHVCRVPGALDLELAASVPEAFITAHDALLQADIKMGEVLIVTGSNGGVGTAAVQLGRLAGTRVLALVRTESVIGGMSDLGVEVISDQHVVARAQALDGADVLLELVPARDLQADLHLLRSGGRLIIVGSEPGRSMNVSPRQLMMRRLTVRGTTLRSRSVAEKTFAIQAFERHVVPFFANGMLRPIRDRVFRADEAEAAFEYLRRPGRIGKVLIDFGGE